MEQTLAMRIFKLRLSSGLAWRQLLDSAPNGDGWFGYLEVYSLEIPEFYPTLGHLFDEIPMMPYVAEGE